MCWLTDREGRVSKPMASPRDRKITRLRCIGLIIGLGLPIFFALWYFSSPMSFRALFAMPMLEAQMHSVENLIATAAAPDIVTQSEGHPITIIEPFCFWSHHSFVYKSNRTWVQIVQSFNYIFADWEKV